MIVVDSNIVAYLYLPGEHTVKAEALLELIRDSNCSAYDCEFVALARRLSTKFVTMDSRLLAAFPVDAEPLIGG